MLTAEPDLDLIRSIAAGAPAVIDPVTLSRVRARRQQALGALADGRLVYGVNTGMGKLSTVRLTEDQQREHQQNLLLARAVGGPPWLGRTEARAVLAVRLVTFLSCDAAVSAALCEHLAAFLNAGLAPAIPRDPMAVAGEVTYLAHAFGPLTGIGHVLGQHEHRTITARNALRRARLARYRLGQKEGIALIQGVPGALALALLRLAETRELAGVMESAAALSIAAIRASRDPYQPACGRGDDLLAAVLGRVRAMAGDEPDPRALQAPVSFRVAGHVLAHVLRAAGQLDAAIRRTLAGVMDSPAFLDGRFTGTAGFHGLDISAHCDLVTAALTHAAEVSATRLHRLMDPAVTGLPAQLAPVPGPQAGLSPLHKRAAGEVHAMRTLVTATTAGLIETSNGQEDVQSFAWEAAAKLRTALRHASVVTGCELLAAAQAIRLSGITPPAQGRDVLDWVGALVPPVTADRPFGTDLDRLVSALPYRDRARQPPSDAGA